MKISYEENNYHKALVQYFTVLSNPGYAYMKFKAQQDLNHTYRNLKNSDTPLNVLKRIARVWYFLLTDRAP